jgi:hypothetical protein
VQFAPAARLVPQLFAKSKDEASAPVNVILAIDTVVVPVLVKVTYCDALVAPTVVAGNVRLVAVRVTGSAGATPVPLNAMLCGELLALSVRVTAAVNAPVAVGAKWP